LRKALSALMVSNVSLVMRLTNASGASSEAQAAPPAKLNQAAPSKDKPWRRFMVKEVKYFCIE
jgi:hypothetical protein